MKLAYRVAAFAVMAMGAAFAPAAADDLRACTPAEGAAAKAAPMPYYLDSVEDLTTGVERLAGYLITIAADGTPTVVCAKDEETDRRIRERGAETIAQFKYWEADVTPPGTLLYVQLMSHGYGATMPSILPTPDMPDCDSIANTATELTLQPLFVPPMTYPDQLVRDGKEGETRLVLEVSETGAVKLICNASGPLKSLYIPAYYNASRIRFAAEPGRAPLRFKHGYFFRIRG